jgi:hypothetical protein
MKTGRIALGIIALTLLAAVRAAPETGINYINMFIRLDDQRAYGLQKLNAAERAKLNEVFGRIVAEREDNLRNSALAYLREQGWDAVELAGTEELTLDEAAGPKTFLSARWRGAGLVLEPIDVSTLMPGSYLGRVDSAVCRVLSPQGKPVEYFIRRTGLPGTGK